MSFTTDLISFLQTDSALGLGTAVSNRIYPSVYPENVYPACVYNIRGGDYDEYSFAGTKTFRSTSVQLDVYVKPDAYQVLDELKERVVERLGKYSGPMGTTSSTVIKTSHIKDIRIIDNGDVKNPLFRLLIDINLTY